MKVKLKSRSGASAVEFAIVLPILVVLVFGIIEFGLILYDKAMITNASREGARYGILANFDPVSGDYAPYSGVQIKAVVDNYLSNKLKSLGASATPNTAASWDPPTPTPGGKLRVTVSYTYTFLVLPNFITSLIGDINMVAETVMRME